MNGFEPKFPQEWKSSDWVSQRQRKKALNCGSEYGFQKVSGLKLSDTRKSWYNQGMSHRECLLWFDDLMDIRDFNGGQHIYIRMAASELA
ncbi:hypothetical protein Tco_0837809, partial [Tanacetum coccineum]